VDESKFDEIRAKARKLLPISAFLKGRFQCFMGCNHPDHEGRKISIFSSSPFQNPKVRKKIEKTLMKKYGVTNAGFMLKKGWHYFYDNEIFDSSWELAFWIWCKDHGEKIIRNKKSFKLKNGGLFYPDFKVGKTYIEVKSNFWKTKTSQNWLQKMEIVNLYKMKIKEKL